MAPFCMNTAKKKFWGRTPRPPFKQNSFRSFYTHEKINIKTFQQLNTLYYLQVVCKTWKARSCPLYLTLALPLPPPPPPSPIFFFFFCFLKNLLRLKINILSSIYPEINFPAEPVMKINNLSRPKVPGPPQNQMVVPLTGSKISKSSMKYLFFRPIEKQRWPSRPLNG